MRAEPRSQMADSCVSMSCIARARSPRASEEISRTCHYDRQAAMADIHENVRLPLTTAYLSAGLAFAMGARRRL